MKNLLVFSMAMAVVAAAANDVRGEVPAQFQAWGSRGPKTPPLAAGWSEVREPVRTLAEASLTADERRRGFLISSPDPLTPVPPQAVPLLSERVEELRLVAARGQYEPATFVLHAIRPLDDVQVAVSELRPAKGGSIPADHVDVRFVRAVRVIVDAKAKTYRQEPLLLEKRSSVSVPKGTALQVWLTLKIPAEAEAGDYAGTIAVTVAGKEAAKVKMTIRVLPFTLPPAPIEVAMFYPNPPASDELLLRQLVDLREHGCNGVEPAMGVVIKSRDQDFGEDDVAATRAQCKRLMDAEQEIFGPRRFPATFGLGHQIAYYWDQHKNWFSFWPRSTKINGDFLRAADVVCQLAKDEGWPPLRAYALDEAGAHNLLDEAVYYYGLLKKHRPDLMTWTDIGGGIAMGIDEIGPLSPCIDVLNTNRFTPEIAKSLIARGKPYAIYNGCGPTPAGGRFFFGFYGYKTGGSQIAQWAYHAGNSVFQGSGLRLPDDGYVYLAEDGPLPSIPWEAVREGIDDYRYLHLLAQCIAGAQTSPDAAVRGAAADGERVLRALLGKIGWGFQALDSAARRPPPHPSTLRKWRWQIAEQILKLRPLVPAAALPGPTPGQVSPLELAWAEPVTVESKYGPELLPPSGFEEGMKPWRVEAWNGKGQGHLDETASHGGRKSVRINVPTASGSQAVTVLVWPTWGDGGLKLGLDRGRRYEFSAWARWQGRGTPPSLRAALPDGAEKGTQNGSDEPTAAGWRRVWTRSELNFPAVPKYLGVWVQGPGTVWIDDLSLREITPPPLEIALDQERYDGLDRVAVCSAEISRRPPPAQVRFSLSRPGGQAMAGLVAPFDVEVGVAADSADRRDGPVLLASATLGRCRFCFDPSKLTPGKYELKVELLNAQSEVVAASSAAVERVEEY